MDADLTAALQQLLTAILSVLAIAIGVYGRKYLLALEAKAVDEGAALAAKTKAVDLTTAHALLLNLVRAADTKLVAALLTSGEAKEQWVVEQAAKIGIAVTLAQVKAAYAQLKAEVAAGGQPT